MYCFINYFPEVKFEAVSLCWVVEFLRSIGRRNFKLQYSIRELNVIVMQC